MRSDDAKPLLNKADGQPSKAITIQRSSSSGRTDLLKYHSPNGGLSLSAKNSNLLRLEQGDLETSEAQNEFYTYQQEREATPKNIFSGEKSVGESTASNAISAEHTNPSSAHSLS